MSTQTKKEMSKQNPPKIPLAALGLKLAVSFSALILAVGASAQDTGTYAPKAGGKYGYQKTVMLPADGDSSVIPDGKEGFADVQKTHFSYKRGQDADWSETPKDDRALLDGTEKSFSYNQLSLIYTDVRPDIQIEQIFKKLPKKSVKEARDYLVKKAKGIVGARAAITGEHHCPTSEALMCFVINRGLEIADIIDSLSDHQQPGVLDQEVRVISDALALARVYYKPLLDFAYDHHHKADDVFNPDYRRFGREFAAKFMVVNESVLSSRAQYAVAYTVLGYFQYDLIRKRTSGEGNANLDANKAAASILFEAMSDDKMVAPDQDLNRLSPFQRLKNIRTLWEAYFEANNVLDKYSAGSPLGQSG